jgi:hypothetical protein
MPILQAAEWAPGPVSIDAETSIICVEVKNYFGTVLGIVPRHRMDGNTPPLLNTLSCVLVWLIVGSVSHVTFDFSSGSNYTVLRKICVSNTIY